MNILLCLISAVMFYLASPNIFSPYGYPLFAWVFAVPLLFALEHKNFRQRLALGAVFSIVAYALILSWVINVNVFLFVFFTLLFAIQPVLFSVILHSKLQLAASSWQLANHQKASRQLLAASGVVFIPALWVVTEAMRAFLIGGYAWTIGHSQAFLPVMIQIADVTGAYGVSFVILLVNTCLYLAIRERRYWFRYVTIALVCVLTTCVYGIMTIKNKPRQHSYKICTVQPNIPLEENIDPFLIDEVINKHIRLSEQCARQKPDLIVWPETAVSDDCVRNDRLYQKIKRFIRRANVSMLIGTASFINGENYNSAVLLNPKGELEGVYHKQRLLPFSEYFPFGDKLLFLKESFHLTNCQFQKGKDPRPLSFHRGRMGIAICSEEGYPALLRKQVQQGAGFVIAMLNDAWFESDAAVMIHAQNGFMTAAMFKKPVVRSTNSGLSCVIDQFGRVAQRVYDAPKLDQSEIFLFDVQGNQKQTFYARFGDAFVLLCVLFVGVIIFYGGCAPWTRRF